jgi:hypothetical protein
MKTKAKRFYRNYTKASKPNIKSQESLAFRKNQKFIEYRVIGLVGYGSIAILL